MAEYPCDTCGYVGSDLDFHIAHVSDLLHLEGMTEWLIHHYVMHRIKLELRR